jgi:hypothetical protein
LILIYTQLSRRYDATNLYPVHFLNKIVPGYTELQEALTILGEPNSIEDATSHPTRMRDNIFDLRPDLQVYIYQNIQNWWWTELWVQKQNDIYVVLAILRFGQLAPKSERLYLDTFVAPYGRPDEVTWTPFCNSRYLIWAKNGVAVSVDTPRLVFENGIRRPSRWDELTITEVLLFEPTDINNILNIQYWPWPNNGAGWSLDKMCSGDVLDTLPKDPFDWEHIPTPAP